MIHARKMCILNLIKIKKLTFCKYTVKRMKIQLTDWEEIFANYISDKELYPKYSKNS